MMNLNLRALFILMALVFSSAEALAGGSGTILGRIQPTAGCNTGAAHLWYSQARTLLYDAEVPPNGTFEIHSVPGTFSIVVTSSSGCFVEQRIDIKPSETNTITIALNRSPQQTASRNRKEIPDVVLSFLTPGSLALADQYCPNCGGPFNNFSALPFYNSTGFYSTPSFFPTAFPWWAGYGAMSYSNFYAPSAWSGGGFNPAMYPMSSGAAIHGGGVGIGKPNIYVTAPSGFEGSINVDMAKSSTWWMAVPSHGDPGWRFKIGPDGAIVSQNARYDYLFFDYRAEQSELQDKKGFCAEPQKIVPLMAEALSKLRFNEREIKDFNDHWSIKLPSSSYYCVYPQLKSDLDRVSKIRATPAPTSVTRVVFVVVTKERLTGKKGKFTREPTMKWTPPSTVQRATASMGFEIREWGVGFLQGR